MKNYFRKTVLLCVVSALFMNVSFAEPKNVDEDKLPAGPKPTDRPSVALVLAGGGAKGFAHLPVIEMIEEVGIPVDMVIGTSIGSIVGGLYAAGYSTSEILKGFDEVDWGTTFVDNAKSPYEDTLGEYSLNRNIVGLNFGMDFSMRLGRGLSNGQRVYQLLKNLTLKYPSNQDFNKLNIPFRAVVTDMLTGEAFVLDEGDLAESIRASMSLPSVFEPVEVDGHYYIDGGVRYNLAINVAKNMGYDIIIAVDISAKVKNNLESYSSNPSVALLNTITIAQYNVIQNLYQYADIIITPDISKYGTLDFKKSTQIYNEGLAVKEKYMPQLEELRKKIYPADYDADGNRISELNDVENRGVYRKRANLIPTKIEIDGVLPQDRKFIEAAFKDIYDEELTPKNFERFMDKIYLTGNYISVRPRIYEDGKDTILHLYLSQKDKHEMKLVLSADFTQTIAPTSMTAFNFNPQLQFRGLTGPGSVIALSGTVINDFGAELFYLQPFNSYFFVASGIEYMDKRYPQMPISFADYKMFDTQFSSYRDMDAKLYFGARTDNGNLIRFGGYYFYKKSSLTGNLYDSYYLYQDEHDDLYYDDGGLIIENWDPAYLALHNYLMGDYFKNGIFARTFGAKVEYEFDHMDRNSFAHSGFYLHGVADLRYAYDNNEPYFIQHPGLFLSLDLKGAIPLGKHASLNVSIFGGMDVLGNTEKSVQLKLAGGFSRFDRVFFPQYTDDCYHGDTKAAVELAVQIEPFDQLTLFGGDLFFRISGTFGNVVDSWKKFFPQTKTDWEINPLIWSASAGVGVKIKNGYDAYLRVGAASCQSMGFYGEYDGKPVAFMALDIGALDF